MHDSFPLWLRLTHFVNFLFITLLIRSGIQILSDHPKLYWNDHCYPGTEWIRFGRRDVPEGALWTSMDEAVPVSPLLALPGKRHALGAGRHWHFLSILFWVVNGLVYVVLLFATDNWRRLAPTSWDVFPRAAHTLTQYLTLHPPPLSEFTPYDPLQQLAYFSVVFLLTPVVIVTGLAMSPALEGRFPWLARLFGGQQHARSIHFLCMIGYVSFLIVHVAMVFLVYFHHNMLHITLGDVHGDPTLALSLFFGGIAFVLAVNVAATLFTRKNTRIVQRVSEAIIEPVSAILQRAENKQQFQEDELSEYFRVNGRPPETEEYLELLQNEFRDYRLVVGGLVDNPLELSLADLMVMPKRSYTSKHVCIQGWTAIGEWAGVPMSEIIKLCRLRPEAKYVYFHSFQIDPLGRNYYTSLNLAECRQQRTILAYEMNYQTLAVEHGAPIRLRVESKLGFKMCKWVKSINFVASLKDFGLGHGGYREDYQYYGTGAEI